MVGGSVPIEPAREIVLSLDRMNAVEDVDTQGNTMIVQAGCILAGRATGGRQGRSCSSRCLWAPKARAASAGTSRRTPAASTLFATGTCATLVLGLEVVLADGRIWNGMNRLRKDNTGYDLKHLFIGAEGTLGIITRAVLKTFPRPKDQAHVTWLACHQAR